MTVLRAVTCRVIPAGQVTVPAAASTVKSSAVKPPATAGSSGPGLITAW
jgi:predicted secreted Zn-dependent protease